MTTSSRKMNPPTGIPRSSSRKIFTPRPPRPASERLPILYRSLTDQLDDGYFENAIKTCKKILGLDPTSKPAFQTLLFLHLHTDDYPSALRLLETPPSESLKQEKLDFESAYCLYRLHREKEALKILEEESGVATRGRNVEHLEAQIRYRLGEYDQAEKIYETLLSNCDSASPEFPDLQTNLKATTIHKNFLSSGYRSHLTQPSARTATGSPSYIPSEAELETYVPSLPTGWGRIISGPSAPVGRKDIAKVEAQTIVASTRSKPRHKLPKGATPVKAFAQDPERWIPLRQRTTLGPKKKGAREGMGTGMTQGSTSTGAVIGSGNGGTKGKKGKKK